MADMPVVVDAPTSDEERVAEVIFDAQHRLMPRWSRDLPTAPYWLEVARAAIAALEDR